MASKPSSKHIEIAQRIFIHELSGNVTPNACADAAARSYGKLREGLDPLLGLLGVEALLTRSLNLTRKQHTWLDELSITENALELRARFREQTPSVCTEAGGLLSEPSFICVQHSSASG